MCPRALFTGQAGVTLTGPSHGRLFSPNKGSWWTSLSEGATGSWSRCCPDLPRVLEWLGLELSVPSGVLQACRINLELTDELLLPQTYGTERRHGPVPVDDMLGLWLPKTKPRKDQ